ncbi:MAG: hypothetical protein DMG15_22560 [Acidobacteria bacterium]|nr:MAG: hypothetical protein DMG16_13015 [Acidobacteriota bacterium]PYS09877.1 MAG: hypothetical protein DMG15_22560 [Acidobacteriota bacterium]
MSQTNIKKESLSSEVRVFVEVDGNPVGCLNLDVNRLWPLINHRKRDHVPVEWMDPAKFDSIMRAAVIKKLIARLETHLYRALGDEMVKAELDVESFKLKAEAAAQTFGRTETEIEKLVLETDRVPLDFYSFFWDYLLDDRDVTDLKKEWKAWDTRPR